MSYPEPMLCEKDLSKFLKKYPNPGSIYISDKEDGVRCTANPATGEYVSRNGKLFPNFDVFTLILRELADLMAVPGVMFDGEVIDPTGTFSSLMTQVHRLKDVDPSIFSFRIFDIVLPEAPFASRYEMLSRAFACRHYHNVNLHPHWLFVGTLTETEVNHLMENALSRGKEGLVLKAADSGYVPGRSIAWCKVKKSDTLDLQVTGIIEGKGKLKGRVGKFLCDFNGVTVAVAPGKLTHDDLARLFDNPPDLIEVEYQEVTEAGSLRHPRCVRVREDK